MNTHKIKFVCPLITVADMKRFYDPDKNIIEVGESMEHLVLRLYRQNHSSDEIAKMTGIY